MFQTDGLKVSNNYKNICSAQDAAEQLISYSSIWNDKRHGFEIELYIILLLNKDKDYIQH